MSSPSILPPRANAIATLLTTDDFLPGAQTLLYSLKKTLAPTPKSKYPPEIIVLVTPNVSSSTRNALHPTFCTRILQVEPIPFPSNGNNDNIDSNSHVKSWDENCGLTKLHIFNLDVYDTILYIDADCLVVKDVGHLLQLGGDSEQDSSSSSSKNRGLIAAAPDIFPPDKFNAGLLVLRPSPSIFTDLIKASTTLTSYDGGDTGLLNAYYPNWFTSMPSSSRLKFGYNAHRFLHSCTYEKQPNYWDVGVKGEEDSLYVIHFSSSPKPWDIRKEEEIPKADAKAMLNEKDAQTISQSGIKQKGKLEKMWKIQYNQSKQYAQRCEEAHLKKRQKDEEEQRKIASSNSSKKTKISAYVQQKGNAQTHYKTIQATS